MTKEEYLKNCMSIFSEGDKITYYDGIITFCNAYGTLSQFNTETNEIKYY